MKLARAVLLLLFTSTLVLAQSGPPERTLFESVNRERKAQNLRALRWDEALAAAEHIFPGEPSLPARANQAGARFISISENVVRAANVKAAHAEFMNSPNHKGNILDSDIDPIVIGIAEHAGELFVVEDFSKAKK